RTRPPKTGNPSSGPLHFLNPARSGDITIRTRILNLLGGRIDAETGETGNLGRGGAGVGGNIHISCDSLSLSGHDRTGGSSEIKALSLYHTTGNAGDSSIQTNNLDLN